MNEQQKQDPKFAKFHGVDREKIQWNPVIDEEKCIGCGMCATTCGRGVYKFDFEKRKAVVANPTQCMVACQTCSNLCPAGAISFAEDGKTREKAQKIVQDYQLLSKTKKELEQKKDELKY
ncbi:MAG: 4Fe-4S dicluster domain-containing protein [Candidatus Moranbacteria bacterium]|nr:4Fe-4S dicluster domain-containing protein [Candidatus Moranbacteria bacterium]